MNVRLVFFQVLINLSDLIINNTVAFAKAGKNYELV